MKSLLVCTMTPLMSDPGRGLMISLCSIGLRYAIEAHRTLPQRYTAQHFGVRKVVFFVFDTLDQWACDCKGGERRRSSKA